jgi:hypothetical protein
MNQQPDAGNREQSTGQRRPIYDSHGTIVGYDADAQDTAARAIGLEL